MTLLTSRFCFFFFNDTATTEIYTLSLHDALPILAVRVADVVVAASPVYRATFSGLLKVFFDLLPRNGLEGKVGVPILDRKSTRLNSSHSQISYAVFCLKKKKKQIMFIWYSVT